MLDLLVFALWDRYWLLRPQCLCLAVRLSPELPDAFRSLYFSRYHTINVAAYAAYGTIEIRQHQGTTSFEKIRTWVLLGQALLDDARRGESAKLPQRTVRDLLDSLGDLLDETAKTFALGRAVEFAAAPVA